MPPLEHLAELTLLAEADVDLAAAQRPGLRVILRDEMYYPPSGPDEVWLVISIRGRAWLARLS